MYTTAAPIDRIAGVTPRLAARAAGIPGSPIDASIGLLQRQTRDVVSFAMGGPAAEAVPSAALRAVAAGVLEAPDAGALGYGPTEGERSLRRELLAFLQRSGTPAGEETLLITAGGTQGLDLACKLLVDPGDLVVAEEPTYSNGVAIVTSYEGRVLRCPTDADGLCVDRIPELVERAGRRPRLFYVVPSFQNPGGATLSLARRRRLLALAERYEALVLEDDPYGLLHFDAAPPASLWSLDGGRGRVIAVHTFSKILAPGLRVGWVLAAPALVERMVAARQGMDTCANVLGQRIVAGWMAEGRLPAHLEALRRLYRQKRDRMEAALAASFADVPELAWSQPGGGFFLWLALPPGIDGQALFETALQEGVAFVPGRAFLDEAHPGNAIRLCFASAATDAIEEGVRRLRRAFDRLAGQQPKRSP